MGGDRTREQESAVDINFDQVAPFFWLDFPEADWLTKIIMPEMGHAKARTIDENLKSAKARKHCLYSALAILIMTDICACR
jgi:hypothetical protein